MLKKKVEKTIPNGISSREENVTCKKWHLHPEILRFLDVTFSSLEEKPLGIETFPQKDKI